MTIKTTDLVDLGAIAASAYDECDTAQKELNAAFGVPYDAAKDNLLRDVRIAKEEGLDLSLFSGDSSRFRYRQFNTNIVVKVFNTPTPHERLDKLANKVAELEQKLKVAKMQLKHTAEELVASGVCDEVVDKIVLAFTRLNK